VVAKKYSTASEATGCYIQYVDREINAKVECCIRSLRSRYCKDRLSLPHDAPFCAKLEFGEDGTDSRRRSMRILELVRADVDATVDHTRKTRAVALVVEQRWTESIGVEARIAGVDGWTAREQRMRLFCDTQFVSPVERQIYSAPL